MHCIDFFENIGIFREKMKWENTEERGSKREVEKVRDKKENENG